MITLMGCRGTTPVSGEKFLKYGGNTPSVFMPINEDECLIIDCGTGINRINTSEILTFKTYHLFFSHLHWDHIIGLPTFKALYEPKSVINIYVQNKSLDHPFLFLKYLFTQPYFPVSPEMLKADINYKLINPGEVYSFGNINLTSIEGCHPNRSLVYKISLGTFSMVFATDYEHHQKVSELIKFCTNAKYLVYDTTYFPEDYRGENDNISKKGWGHSTYVQGTKLAKKAGVSNFVLYHHNPEYDDNMLDKMLYSAQKLFHKSICSYDGIELD